MRVMLVNNDNPGSRPVRGSLASFPLEPLAEAAADVLLRSLAVKDLLALAEPSAAIALRRLRDRLHTLAETAEPELAGVGSVLSEPLREPRTRDLRWRRRAAGGC